MNDRLKIEYLKIDQIKPYEKNAKKHPKEQIEQIANSIKEFGFQQPLVVDKENVLIIGHGRLKAAKKLNYRVVPVVRANDLTEEQVKALRLADNKTNESDWDFNFLGDELDEIFDIDMEMFGFQSDFIAKEEIEGGEIKDNQDLRVAVKIVFKNTKHWRKLEDQVREFVDKLEDVSVSVGEYDEDQQSNSQWN